MVLDPPWRNEHSPTTPWARQGLQDRMHSERLRIRAAEAWYKRFMDSSGPAKMDEVRMFSIPVRDIGAAYQGKINALWGSVVGLAPLYDDNVFPVVAALHPERGTLPPHRYVRIVSAHREHVTGPKGVLPVLVIEELEVLRAEQAWRDLDLPPMELPKIFAEALPLDAHLSSALLAPVASTPANDFGAGGLTMTGFKVQAKTRAVETLLDVLEAAAPPEMRDKPARPGLMQGANLHVHPAASFLFAVRPPPARDSVRTFLKPLESISPNAFARGRHGQETSIYGALALTANNPTTAFRNLLAQSGRSDLLFPERLDSLVAQGHDLERAGRQLNDDRVWAAVVAAHDMAPGLHELGPVTARYLELLHQSVDAELSGVEPRDARRRPLVQGLLNTMEPAMMRLTLEQARLAGRPSANEADLKNAYRLQKDLFIHLWRENDEARGIKLSAVAGLQNQASRTPPVQTALLTEPGLRPEAIFQRVKHTELFEDLDDVIGYLEWARRKGLVTVDQKGAYHWVL